MSFKCSTCTFMSYDDRSPEMCQNRKLIHKGYVVQSNHFIPYCETILEKLNGKCKYYKFSLFALFGIFRG